MRSDGNDFTELFAENLKKHRKEAGLTQAQLGAMTGYSEKAVSKWECGISTPPANALFLLAEVFGVGIEEFFAFASAPKYYLGIDGGGTKTEFALADASGNVLRKIKLGSSNPVDIGFDKSAAVMDEGIRRLTGGIPKKLISVFAGIAGGTSGNMKADIHAFLSRYGFFRAENGSDAENIVAAGLRERDGIALIMGTGCSAFVKKGNRLLRLGGLGYLFDHGGSAYDIGNNGIRAACYAESGAGPDTLLKKIFTEELKTQTVTEKLDYFYSTGKVGIASYAPLVFKAYRSGDAEAAAILMDNMLVVANLIISGSKILGGNKPYYVVMAGGLTAECEILLPFIREHIAQKINPDDFDLNVFRGSAVDGALIRAGLSSVREG